MLLFNILTCFWNYKFLSLKSDILFVAFGKRPVACYLAVVIHSVNFRLV